MLYPVYVHHEQGKSFGITIPDFPGCFSAADTWEELPAMVQQAIELHCENELIEIPAPSSIADLSSDFKDGQWVFIDVNLNKLNTKVLRLNITLKESLVHQVDSVVEARGMTRSGFLAAAAEEKLAREEV